MSYGFDEFESKLGQFIYTMVMYERLKEYLIEKVRGKGKISIRIDLGKDKAGNQVVMDVTLSTIPGEAKYHKFKDMEGNRKKSLLLVMSNDKIKGDEKEIAKDVERLINESLKWWHGYFGERDRLSLDNWKSEKSLVTECISADFIVEIPTDRVIVPPKRKLVLPEEVLEKVKKIAGLLGYPTVKSLGDGIYELVNGHIQFMVAKKMGAETIKALLIEATEKQSDEIFREYVNEVYNLLKEFKFEGVYRI